MDSYARYIETVIEKQPVNRIFEARSIYEKSCDMVPETSYYKTLERMSKYGTLVHLAKGVYYRPQKSRFGIVPIGEDEIIDHYTRNDQGLVVGYRLYNKKGLTTQIGKQVEVLSSAISEQKKNVSNVCIRNAGVNITKEMIPIIETLEILQNYRKIEDMNQTVFAAYMRKFSFRYSDPATIFVLNQRKYKKSTIAFLERFLNYFKVENTLNQFLSSLSSYEIPNMEEFYGSAQTQSGI